ncbi:cell division protein FtsX [Flavitalea sp.]|nr:permease-like cell division protein FtsX [Flavitalea sp.]
MAQFGKASAKRSKPSYFMAILGVTIVLFFVGIFGWLFLNAQMYVKKLKEDVTIQVYLRKTASQADIDSLKAYIIAKPYTKTLEYIDKEKAKEKWLASNDEKSENFDALVTDNPLPASIDFNLNNNYVHKDTIANIKTDLELKTLVVESVNYPSALVEKMGPSMRWILIGLVVLACIFSLFSIILIDNTIKLAMYSNRFLIKTMQMVGATRSFISRPLNTRAVINGSIAALIAIAMIYGIIILFESFVPDLKDLRNNSSLLLVFLLLFILGIGITMFSTHRSVVKYLRMKLDDLY